MRHQLAIPLFIVLLLAACGGRLPRPEAGAGAPAAPAAVERFLQTVQEQDYLEMGWVFGTEEGPVMTQWPRPEVEKRMYALATVLRHDSFVVGSGAPVPGRIGRALRFEVTLNRGGQTFNVPVVAVRGPESRWFVEQVALESVTNVK